MSQYAPYPPPQPDPSQNTWQPSGSSPPLRSPTSQRSRVVPLSPIPGSLRGPPSFSRSPPAPAPAATWGGVGGGVPFFNPLTNNPSPPPPQPAQPAQPTPTTSYFPAPPPPSSYHPPRPPSAHSTRRVRAPSPLPPQGPRYHLTYGLSLSHTHLHSLCPSATYQGIARLPGFLFSLTPRGEPTIRLSPEDEVFGGLWVLPPAGGGEEDKLDEGAVGRGYTGYDLAVTPLSRSGQGQGQGQGQQEEEVVALVYIDPTPGSGPPTEETIQLINAGLRDTPLPPTYISRYIRPLIPAPPPPPPDPIPSIPSPEEEPPKFYFAYGPDMSTRELWRVAPQARGMDVALLPGWKWVVGRGGEVGLVRRERGVVWGVVFSLSVGDERGLDAFNGVGKAGRRERRRVDVRLENGRGVVRALLYIDPRDELDHPQDGYGVDSTDYRGKEYNGQREDREIIPGRAGEELVRKMQDAIWEARLPREWVERCVRPWMFGDEVG